MTELQIQAFMFCILPASFLLIGLAIVSFAIDEVKKTKRKIKNKNYYNEKYKI